MDNQFICGKNFIIILMPKQFFLEMLNYNIVFVIFIIFKAMFCDY